MATLVNFDTHSATTASVDRGLGNRATCNEACTLESLTIRVSASGTWTVRVWALDGSELGSGSASGSGTFTIALSSPVKLSAATDYIFTAYSSAGGVRYADSGLTSHNHDNSPYSFTWVELRFSSPGSDTFPTNTLDRCAAVSLNVSPPALSATLTPATETDTAQPVARTKRKAIATVTETDGAQAITAKKQRALQPATETDTAIPFPTAIIVQLATVTETDEARPITRDASGLRYRVIFPTYPRTFQNVPIGQTARFVLDQAVSIVRINGSLRQFRNPSQTMLEAAGTEGTDWFIGGRIYDEISYTTHLELQAAGFETEAVA